MCCSVVNRTDYLPPSNSDAEGSRSADNARNDSNTTVDEDAEIDIHKVFFEGTAQLL